MITEEANNKADEENKEKEVKDINNKEESPSVTEKNGNMLEKLNNKELAEENKETDDDETLAQKIREQWQLMFKIVELIFCALCFAFFFLPANKSANIVKHHFEQASLILLAFVGYILINVIFIISRCLRDKIPFRTSALFSFVGALLCFISGILLIVDKDHKFSGIYVEPHRHLATMLSAATVFSFINAIFFTIDGIYTIILKEDF